ncbi:hypothetical protein [Pseudomonas sp. Ps21-P2]|uniref:hypothetical protein n=1 Tax=Pseudomonas sp. Ps21-P2 TaxID=3080331 RepID=UPI003209231C
MNQRNEKPRVDGAFFHAAFTRQHSPLRPIGLRQAARVLTSTRPNGERKMHQLIQQKRETLTAIRARAHLATAELYAMIGKEPPAQPIRYQVIRKSADAWHVVEISTGKVRGFRFSYKEAVNYAQVLEARADGMVVTLSQAVLQ